MSNRFLIATLLMFAGLLLVGWIVLQGQLPPADFTFNNNTDIESLDPAVVTGQPEGRIIEATYEGLVRIGPRYREPQPGAAERWEISDDGLTYTFYLRENAQWTNGEPVTADDFVYSMRRFLNPTTLAEYAYQAWYLKNARRFSRAARGVEVGDLVEVELHTQAEGALPFAAGEIVRGKLTSIETAPNASEADLADPAKFTELRTFVVSVTQAGAELERRFRVTADADAASQEDDAPRKQVTSCKQLLLDFNEVGCRAIDERTVEMVLESPTPFWLQLLGFYPLSPVNRTCVETHGSPQWASVENIVTNGAYEIKFRRIRDRIRLEKNQDYWDADNVAINTIDALMVESTTTGFNLYETGKLDWLPQADPLIFRELLKSESPRDDLHPQPQFGTYFYGFNVTRPPLDDVRVRQALVLSVDREEIIKVACAGEVQTRSFTPPGLTGYIAPMCPEPNVEKARQLLTEAGYPNGQGFPKIDLLYNFSEQHQTIAELLRKQWQSALGINVATRNEEWSTYLASQRLLRFDAVRRAWIGDYLDPNTFLDLFVTGGENNNTGWGNAEYDDLIRKARTESDPTTRLAMLKRAETILMDEVPVIPIYNYVSRNLVRPHVRGFWNNLQDTHPLQFLKIDRNATGPSDLMADISSIESDDAAKSENEAEESE